MDLMSSNQLHVTRVFNLVLKAGPVDTDEFEDLLVDYTVDGDLKKTVINFLQKTIGQSFDESSVQQATSGVAHEGCSGNSILFIRDKKGDLKLVVKTFAKPFEFGRSAPFLRELFGFQIASTLRGNHFNFVSALAFGKCEINKEKYGLLAISPAPGENIADMLFKASSLELGSSSRRDALLVIRRAIKKLGMALKELHSVRAKKGVGVHPDIVRAAEKNLSKVRVLLQKNNVVDPEALHERFYSLLNCIEKAEITHCIAHGDANLKNFMYDKKTDSIFMVDLEEFSGAADRDGNPISNAVLDLAEISELAGGCPITKEEVAGLKKAFIKSYGDFPTSLEKDFFSLVWRLKATVWAYEFLHRECGHPKRLTMIFEDWLQFSFDDLKKIVEKGESEKNSFLCND